MGQQGIEDLSDILRINQVFLLLDEIQFESFHRN